MWRPCGQWLGATCFFLKKGFQWKKNNFPAKFFFPKPIHLTLFSRQNSLKKKIKLPRKNTTTFYSKSTNSIPNKLWILNMQIHHLNYQQSWILNNFQFTTKFNIHHPIHTNGSRCSSKNTKDLSKKLSKTLMGQL